MPSLDDDGELEEPAELAHGPPPQGKPARKDAEPERHRPPPGAWEDQVAAARHEHPQRQATEDGEGERDEAPVAALDAGAPGADRKRSLERGPPPGAEPERQPGGSPMDGEGLHSSCQGVRIRGPSSVTATVNSKWAASEPSWE